MRRGHQVPNEVVEVHSFKTLSKHILIRVRLNLMSEECLDVMQQEAEDSRCELKLLSGHLFLVRNNIGYCLAEKNVSITDQRLAAERDGEHSFSDTSGSAETYGWIKDSISAEMIDGSSHIGVRVEINKVVESLSDQIILVLQDAALRYRVLIGVARAEYVGMDVKIAEHDRATFSRYVKRSVNGFPLDDSIDCAAFMTEVTGLPLSSCEFWTRYSFYAMHQMSYELFADAQKKRAIRIREENHMKMLSEDDEYLFPFGESCSTKVSMDELLSALKRMLPLKDHSSRK